MTTNIELTISALMDISAKISRLIAFTLIVLAHLVVLMGLLFYIWWTQLNPDQLEALVSNFFQQTSLSKFLGTLGFLGVSVLAVTMVYVKACKRLALWLVREYVSPKPPNYS